jgi:hypothetical protein
MASEEKEKGFTVQDRRRFSSEGESRSEQPEEKPAPRASAPQGAPASQASPERHEALGPEVTFTTFMVGLSTQALAALGEIPDPMSGQHSKDLGAAQQLIDIIGMLREKTRGNLDRDEDGLIEAILFDLRMKYVELARQSGR